MINQGKNTLVVNLYGGPATGKGATAALLFGTLKRIGIDCELVRGYAKDLYWEECSTELIDQCSILGKQLKRINSAMGKVDVIVTDSPILLSAYYNSLDKDLFTQLCFARYKRFNNLDVFLERIKKYNPNGRPQTEEEAQQIDKEIKELLQKNDVFFASVKADENSIEILLDYIEERCPHLGSKIALSRINLDDYDSVFDAIYDYKNRKKYNGGSSIVWN